jgi:hypothetical protein
VVDLADIVALAPDADRDAAAAVVRILNRRHQVLAASVCRGGHLHVLTNRGFFLADRSFAYEEASKSQMGGAVVTSRSDDGVSVSVLAFGGLQPPHQFATAAVSRWPRR